MEGSCLSSLLDCFSKECSSDLSCGEGLFDFGESCVTADVSAKAVIITLTHNLLDDKWYCVDTDVYSVLNFAAEAISSLTSVGVGAFSAGVELDVKRKFQAKKAIAAVIFIAIATIVIASIVIGVKCYLKHRRARLDRVAKELDNSSYTVNMDKSNLDKSNTSKITMVTNG